MAFGVGEVVGRLEPHTTHTQFTRFHGVCARGLMEIVITGDVKEVRSCVRVENSGGNLRPSLVARLS